MKENWLVWLMRLSVIGLCYSAFLLIESHRAGTLGQGWIQDTLLPLLSKPVETLEDLKFRMRGSEPVKHPIVILEIDSPSIETLGRWPWHRDVTSLLIEKTFESGAKFVGLDITFSEPDTRIPDTLKEVAKTRPELQSLDLESFETDPMLTKVVERYKSQLVLGILSESACHPKLLGPELCPVGDPEAMKLWPKGFERFHLETRGEAPTRDQSRIVSFLTGILNLPEYQDAAIHLGYLNAFLDPDAVIRNAGLVAMAGGGLLPSLALKMASLVRGESPIVTWSKDGGIAEMKWSQTGDPIQVNPLGSFPIRFRGPGALFKHVTATQVLRDEAKETLKDAIVLVGLTAIGVFDMRNFPFETNAPGVEGHANILDNLIQNDPLSNGSSYGLPWLMHALMLLGGLALFIATSRLNAFPAMGLFFLSQSFIFGLDFLVLFPAGLYWNTAYLYIQCALIFFINLAIKYVLEEKNKLFIKDAFSKYVAPSIVDSIIKDPEKLSLGGEKSELTILFSDIRSFTTMSEKMDAKQLASFLNDYLGIMTKLVFSHKGTLDKYIGDAVMAFWGAPLHFPDHAASAAASAVAMMQALHQNQGRYKELFDIDVDIGIGINSGVVNVGNMGSEDNFEYTVIGDHVNLASRLEGLTKTYGSSILTTRFTLDSWEASKAPLIPHRTLDFVKVKGKEKAVELIELLVHPWPDELLVDFQAARQLYIAQDWKAAKAAFEGVIEKLGRKDGPSSLFLERCLFFEAQPPGKDWDGSWKMDSK